ncbi:hypothetical protein GCM10027271_19570 [Saccharopolyspora gloriosae]|uniref:PE domain-containing protein n=1 Tax=Saccharopolyspora gloriosae TaxID=455344 RepID=A0A840NBJ4_9PSEU|nr:hypothetical protein [Saccharopolyspora gloriosae]MBB5067505.1 hypothetical protein [Saccharopolyspora gloriosae]
MTSAEAGGFAAAKEGLKAVSAQTQSINQSVGAGMLSLDPEVAEKAAKRVEEEIEALQGLYSRALALQRVKGLGDYPDGQQLAKRFQDKAVDAEAGALPLIRLLQGELVKQAEAFRGAARDYRSIDDQNADDLSRGIQ